MAYTRSDLEYVKEVLGIDSVLVPRSALQSKKEKPQEKYEARGNWDSGFFVLLPQILTNESEMLIGKILNSIYVKDFCILHNLTSQFLFSELPLESKVIVFGDLKNSKEQAESHKILFLYNIEDLLDISDLSVLKSKKQKVWNDLKLFMK